MYSGVVGGALQIALYCIYQCGTVKFGNTQVFCKRIRRQPQNLKQCFFEIGLNEEYLFSAWEVPEMRHSNCANVA